MFFKCKDMADEILAEVKSEVSQLMNYPMGLAIIKTNDDAASAAYMKGKMNDCKLVGFPCTVFDVKSYDEFVQTLEALNRDYEAYAGVIVQLPLPNYLSMEFRVRHQEPTDFVCRAKDVDGFRDGSPFHPCTPEGILEIMLRKHIRLQGAHVVILGRGKLVGAPLTKILNRWNATVSICNSHTSLAVRNKLIWSADVVVSATNQPQSLNLDFLGLEPLRNPYHKLVIDCGIYRQDGKLVGDVVKTDFTVSAGNIEITDVPGGVGLMTRAMLMKHLLQAQDQIGG